MSNTLTGPQREALERAARGGSVPHHRYSTVRALYRRGLVKFARVQCGYRLQITDAGRAALDEATTTTEIVARMDAAAAQVIATDRAILSMGVSEIAARYRCSADVARRALMAARSAQATQAADDWTAAGAREVPEWRRTY